MCLCAVLVGYGDRGRGGYVLLAWFEKRDKCVCVYRDIVVTRRGDGEGESNVL